MSEVGGGDELQKVSIANRCFSGGYVLRSWLRCARHPDGGSGCYAHDPPTNDNPRAHEYANRYTSDEAANGKPPAYEHPNQ